jgi:CHASE3 domain sensor protein
MFRTLRKLTPLPGRVLTGFVCALAVFIAIGLSATHSLEQVVATDRWIADAHRGVEQLHLLDSAARVAQSSQRAFVLTGSEDYLIAFNDAQSTAMSALGQVTTLSGLAPHRAEDVALLGRSVQQLLRECAQQIELRQKAERMSGTRGWPRPHDVPQRGRGLPVRGAKSSS